MARPQTTSVIITSYNQERYLKETIESALGQDMRPHQIIIADDYSTRDRSRQLIRDYELKHSGLVTGIYHQFNVGVPRNRNVALKRATGEYVTIVDGDDRLAPDYLSAHLGALAKNPRAGCSYSSFYQWYPNGDRVPRDAAREPEGNVIGHFAAGRMGILHSLLARTELVRRAGGLDERLPWHDGFVLGLRLATMTQFCYVDRPLVDKREHEAGISRSIPPEDLVEQFKIIISEVEKVMPAMTEPERRISRQTWGRRLLESQVKADLKSGARLFACYRIMKQMTLEPGRLRPLLRLLRDAVAYT